jgi:glutamate synthase (NADPH) small chain
MDRYILKEAQKCLQCKKPKCKEGCPVSTPINEMINLLLAGNIIEAGEKLFSNNPLSLVCSYVCPHELQCEGNCILGKKNNAVQISAIENYISDFYLNSVCSVPLKKLDHSIAIIGSGPAGITIAFMLASKGYRVTIFEAHDKIGGVLRYGIPEFRLPKNILEKIKDKLGHIGVKIRPNTLIGPYINIDDLFRDGYEAVFIGTGVWKPNVLGIKGETLGHVHYAIDYLKNPDVYELGDKVCIIGAGNVAMDVARTAIRKGSREVYIMYRKGEDDIKARPLEVQYARLDGVRFEFYKNPLEIVEEGVKYIEIEEIIDDAGNKKLVDVKDSVNIFKVDSVIISVSQGPRNNIIMTSQGINTDENGLVKTDEFGKTSRAGIFASGDVVTGAKTVVEAVNLSKKVANTIDEYIKSIEK